jgi:hypothetical protein
MDTLNLFEKEDNKIQCLRYYWYYATLSLPRRGENIVCTLGFSLVGCVPEVFYSKEIVSWCVDKFVSSRRVIQLQSGSFISLVSLVFRKMLKLTKPTNTFKGEEARNFLKKKNNGLNLLQEYLEDPVTILVDISRTLVILLNNPYR